MSFKSLAAWFPLLLAIPDVSSAQTISEESRRPNTVAIHRQDTHDWDAEERLSLKALDVAITATGDQRPAIYRIYLNLANLNAARHKYAVAERYYQCAYETAKGSFGRQSEEAVKALNHLGEMRLEQGRIPEADGTFSQVLKILESSQGATGINTAAVLNNLAAVQYVTHHLSKAAALMRKVVGILETEPAAEEASFATALSNLAWLLREVGNLPDAITTAQRAVSILERGASLEQLQVGLVVLSRLHLDKGDSASAETMLQRALRSIESSGKDDCPTHALIFGHFGALLGRTGRYGEAEPYLQRSIEINRRFFSADHPRLLDSMGAYAEFLRMTKRKGEAKKLEAYIREKKDNSRQQNPSFDSVVDVKSLMNQRGH
jgi:tetratricopeptide (TPR) repeat protein